MVLLIAGRFHQASATDHHTRSVEETERHNRVIDQNSKTYYADRGDAGETALKGKLPDPDNTRMGSSPFSDTMIIILIGAGLLAAGLYGRKKIRK